MKEPTNPAVIRAASQYLITAIEKQYKAGEAMVKALGFLNKIMANNACDASHTSHAYLYHAGTGCPIGMDNSVLDQWVLDKLISHTGDETQFTLIAQTGIGLPDSPGFGSSAIARGVGMGKLVETTVTELKTYSKLAFIEGVAHSRGCIIQAAAVAAYQNKNTTVKASLVLHDPVAGAGCVGLNEQIGDGQTVEHVLSQPDANQTELLILHRQHETRSRAFALYKCGWFQNAKITTLPGYHNGMYRGAQTTLDLWTVWHPVIRYALLFWTWLAGGRRELISIMRQYSNDPAGQAQFDAGQAEVKAFFPITDKQAQEKVVKNAAACPNRAQSANSTLHSSAAPSSPTPFPTPTYCLFNQNQYDFAPALPDTYWEGSLLLGAAASVALFNWVLQESLDETGQIAVLLLALATSTVAFAGTAKWILQPDYSLGNTKTGEQPWQTLSAPAAKLTFIATAITALVSLGITGDLCWELEIPGLPSAATAAALVLGSSWLAGSLGSHIQQSPQFRPMPIPPSVV